MDDFSGMMSSMMNGPTIIFTLAAVVLTVVAEWKIFEKAGEAGWKILIPFYNTYTLVKIADGNGVKFLLLLVPFVNIVYAIMLMVRLAKSFGQSGGFAVGLIFLPFIFLLILAFGGAQYVGPNGEGAQYTDPTVTQ